jgi:DNA-directed RNA polymerase alpha subunit
MENTHSVIFEHLKKNVTMLKLSTSLENQEAFNKLNQVLNLIDNCKISFELELHCAKANAKNEILLKVMGHTYKQHNFSDEEIKLRKLLQMKVVEIDIPYRVMNVLKWSKIETLGDLVSCDRENVQKFRNLGSKSLAVLDDLLEKYNLKWSMRVGHLFLNEA